MGDSGEGLVDNEARISERRDEIERARREKRELPPPANPEQAAALESLRLARAELRRQLNATSHETRRKALSSALADLDARITALGGS
jgi:hypothetical protein